MLEITDLSKLRITKVKYYAVYFVYDNRHYLIHTSNDSDSDGVMSLYERFSGNRVNRIASCCDCDMPSKLIRLSYGKNRGTNNDEPNINYNQIDKEYFVRRLIDYRLVE